MTSDTRSLETLPQLARRFGVSVRQVEYAAARYAIEPVGRIGLVRCYDAGTAERLESALRRTGAIPPARRNPREAAHA